MALAFPILDPIALKLGPLAIRWYSLAYIGGILAGWLIVKRELSKRPLANLSGARIDDLVLCAIAGIILGGRLGYALFYKPEYFLDHPLEILEVWRGGMSFHGGFAGFVAAFWLFCRKHQIPFLPLMDLMACVAPIGIGLGRIANFINGELWGRPSDVPWAMVFPHADALPRHPSQIYEALAEGAVLLALMMALLHYSRLRERPGALCGVFLLGYGVARILCEGFREPDVQLGFIVGGVTMGQLLCIPMLLLGLFLWIRTYRHGAA